CHSSAVPNRLWISDRRFLATIGVDSRFADHSRQLFRRGRESGRPGRVGPRIESWRTKPAPVPDSPATILHFSPAACGVRSDVANRNFHVHLLSDSTGETVTSVARACLVQYEGIFVQEHVWSLVRTKGQLEKVIQEIERYRGPVLYTLVDQELRDL